MSALHEDLQVLTAEPTDDVRLVYDRVAPGYDRFRERWLKLAGAEAEQAMLAELTMLDLSLQMLVRSADIPRKHVLGSVLELPFPADRLDVVVSAWVIETLPDPMRAVSEPLARPRT